MNLYGFVWNDGINWVDKDGRIAPLLIVGGRVLWGAGTDYVTQGLINKAQGKGFNEDISIGSIIVAGGLGGLLPGLDKVVGPVVKLPFIRKQPPKGALPRLWDKQKEALDKLDKARRRQRGQPGGNPRAGNKARDAREALGEVADIKEELKDLTIIIIGGEIILEEMSESFDDGLLEEKCKEEREPYGPGNPPPFGPGDDFHPEYDASLFGFGAPFGPSAVD